MWLCNCEGFQCLSGIRPRFLTGWSAIKALKASVRASTELHSGGARPAPHKRKVNWVSQRHGEKLVSFAMELIARARPVNFPDTFRSMQGFA